MCYPIRAEDQLTIKWFPDNRLLKTLTEYSIDFLAKPKWWMKSRKSSLKNISQTKRETTTKYWESKRMPQCNRLPMLTEDLLWNIIQNQIQTMNRLKGNSLKLIKLIKLFPIEPIAQLMMISCLETSFPAELLTFLKISLKTDGWTCPQKLNFSNQSLAEGDQWERLDQWDHSNQWEETEQEAWWDLKWV